MCRGCDGDGGGCEGRVGTGSGCDRSTGIEISFLFCLTGTDSVVQALNEFDISSEVCGYIVVHREDIFDFIAETSVKGRSFGGLIPLHMCSISLEFGVVDTKFSVGLFQVF